MSRHRLPNRGKKTDDSVDGTTENTAEENTETGSEATELTESSVETSSVESASVESGDVEVGDEPAETEAEPAADAPEPAADAPEPVAAKRTVDWARVVAYGVLPALALLLAMAAGYLKWMDNSVRNADTAAIESVQVARDSTVAMLSYKPDTVEQQLNDARNLLTGEFQESYTGLINDVVIPGAKEKQITAVASVPAAASVSAEPDKAVVLVFVNQTVAVGQDPPSDTASSVRVTLEKIDGRWLIAKFDPV